MPVQGVEPRAAIKFERKKMGSTQGIATDLSARRQCVCNAMDSGKRHGSLSALCFRLAYAMLTKNRSNVDRKKSNLGNLAMGAARNATMRVTSKQLTIIASAKASLPTITSMNNRRWAIATQPKKTEIEPTVRIYSLDRGMWSRQEQRLALVAVRERSNELGGGDRFASGYTWHGWPLKRREWLRHTSVSSTVWKRRH